VLLFVSSIKLVAEIALLALLGRFILGLLAGAKRDSNVFYQLLDTLAKPFIHAARWVSPRQVLDRHLPLVAGLLLGFLWLGALIAKVNICLQLGMEACR
jgi:hypothetical protein